MSVGVSEGGWYDSDIGRFISEDPLWGNILDPQSLNRFAYGRNNPYRFTDPMGLWTASADDMVNAGIKIDHDSSFNLGDDLAEFDDGDGGGDDGNAYAAFNNPSLELWDDYYVFGGGVAVFGGWGGELSLGLFIGDNFTDFGVFISGGFGWGVNVSVDVFGGRYKSKFDGNYSAYNVVAGPFSGSGFTPFDRMETFTGGTFGLGPSFTPVGGHVSHGKTITANFQEMGMSQYDPDIHLP